MLAQYLQQRGGTIGGSLAPAATVKGTADDLDSALVIEPTDKYNDLNVVEITDDVYPNGTAIPTLPPKASMSNFMNGMNGGDVPIKAPTSLMA